jgi:cell division protein FtsB
MTEVFEISVYLTASLIFFAVSYLAFSYYLSNRRMANGILKMSAQIEALQRKLEQLQKESESRKVENTDAFVRFVSQSRDKAFEYIEDV